MPLEYHLVAFAAISLATIVALYSPRWLLNYVWLPLALLGFVVTQAAFIYLMVVG